MPMFLRTCPSARRCQKAYDKTRNAGPVNDAHRRFSRRTHEIDVLILNGTALSPTIISSDVTSIEEQRRAMESLFFEPQVIVQKLLESNVIVNEGTIVAVSKAVVYKSTDTRGHYIAAKSAFKAYLSELWLFHCGINVLMIDPGNLDGTEKKFALNSDDSLPKNVTDDVIQKICEFSYF